MVEFADTRKAIHRGSGHYSLILLKQTKSLVDESQNKMGNLTNVKK